MKENDGIGEYFGFLKEYARNVRETGSIMPDSDRCVASLLHGVPFGSAKLILEYGPASGKVTREIVRRKRPETVLISVEKNPRFHGRLIRRIHGPNVNIVHGDVTEWARRSFGLQGNVDCIISTLPCSCMDVESLLVRSVAPLLKRNGIFIQYMHSVSLLKGFSLYPLLKKHFIDVRTDFVLRNVPPAFIYTAVGRRALGEQQEYRGGYPCVSMRSLQLS